VNDGVDLCAWDAGSGLLSDYEAYWLPTTDAPRVYHVAAGLVVIAAAVENRVYLPFGGERIYPNLWALVLGPSSFFRKSTVVNKARKTITRLYDGDPHTALLPDEFSREAFLKRLSERGQGTLTYSEFSGALASFGRDYMSGTKETLADLYDCPATYSRVVGAQSFTIRDACLSILAASQTDWFLEKLKAGDVRGGFLARFSFWPAFEKKRFLALPPDPDVQLGNRLVTGLNELRRVKGVALLGTAQRDRYAKWLERHERDLHGSAKVGELSAFWSRLSIMALKFAMLIQLAHDRSLTVSEDNLTRALALTDFLKRALRHLFDEEFAFSKDMQDRQRVLRAVQRRPGISYRDLLRASSLLKRQIDPVLETLVAEGSIERRMEDRAPSFYPSAASTPVSNTGTDTERPMFMRVK
jgi:hypothetical protein